MKIRQRPVATAAITGIGMICPVGITVATCWDNLLAGRSGIRPIAHFDAREFETRIGGQLPAEYLQFESLNTPARLYKQTNLAGRIARLCAKSAVEDCSRDLADIDPFRCAVVIGTSDSLVPRQELAEPGLETYRALREMTNALPAWISLLYGFKGPSFTISSGCSSGLQAVARACDLIRWGMADLVIAGGADHFLDSYGLRFVGNRMKLLSRRNEAPERAMRPFDGLRDGFVLSDGGCVFVLESRETALKRNAKAYAWIGGHWSVLDTSCGDSPEEHAESMAGTMKAALDACSVSAKEIGYIAANGVSTIQHDLSETMAIKEAFGRHAYNLNISAPKSMIGHTVGASGAIDLAVAAMALHTGKIPPTINHEVPDPLCDLSYVPNSMTTVPDLRAALINSFGFAGDFCSMVITRFPDH